VAGDRPGVVRCRGPGRLLTPLVAAHLREWAILVGAMAATAILFDIYPLMHALTN